MTAEHPSIDVLADYSADLLPGHSRGEVATHLAQCVACAADILALGEVSDMLAAEAAAAPSMPDTVVRRIDAALRREAAGGDGAAVVLSDRSRSTATTARSRAPSWPLLAAAAVVTVVGGAAVLQGQLGATDSDTQAGADSAVERSTADDQGGAAGGAAQSRPGKQPTTRQDFQQHLEAAPPQLSPDTLPAYAARLDQAPTSAPVMSRCAAAKANASDIVAGARWKGMRAVVVVDPARRQARVLECGLPTVVLYRTKY